MFYLHMFFILVCSYTAYEVYMEQPSENKHVNMLLLVANILAVIANCHALQYTG